MNMNKRLAFVAIGIIALLSALALPATARAAEVVWAEVDRTTLSTDEWLTLTVTVDAIDGMLAQPILPRLDGFEVVSSGSSTQMDVVNGRMSVKTLYQYQMRPTRVGDQVIDPIEVMLSGRAYWTQPIRITVTQGSGQVQPRPRPGVPSLPFSMPSFNMPMPSLPPAAPMDPADASPELNGQDLLVEARVDRPVLYQGEQVVYTFRFYRAVNLWEQPEYEAPDFAGLWREHQVEQQDYTLDAAGRDYRVTELRSVLFPMMAGPLTIDPAVLTVPGDLFDRGHVLQTKPVSLDVLPLPPGAPAGFQGAVGRFTIEAQVDTTETTVNEAVTLRVTLSGQGNVASLPDPEWTEGSEWRAFDSQATSDSWLEGDTLFGSRTYERLLVPTVAGELLLPAIEYSYFVPETETYDTVATDPVSVRVAPGADPGAAAAPLSSDADPASVAPTMRSIKPATAPAKGASTQLTQRPEYWLLWCLPPLLLVGQWALQRQRRAREGDVVARRSRQAAAKARRQLRQADQDPAQAHVVAGRIVVDYIADKLDRPVGGWTQTRVADLLLERGVDTDLVERVQACLALGEMGAYAPAPDGSECREVLAETQRLIDDLERAL